MIIAVDFDGILVEDQFPEIGSPKEEMVVLVRQLIATGYEVVLWTSRTDARLAEAVEWCIANGLRFSAINDQAPSNKAKYQHIYPHGTRKVYADLYVDDHNIGYSEEITKQELRNLIWEVLEWKEEN